jgi:ParB-like chromosome segregation protein Spo0J
MPSVIEALERIVIEGGELVACSEADLPRLQDWLSRRQELFAGFDDAIGQLAADDRQSVSSLIDKLLQLDSRFLNRVNERLRVLGDELGAVERLKSFIGTTGRADAPSFLSRAV